LLLLAQARDAACQQRDQERVKVQGLQAEKAALQAEVEGLKAQLASLQVGNDPLRR
jgi:uncharacterized small protein (DUF1192 family)